VLKLNEIVFILNDLSGAIFKKAELNDDFVTTYSDVFKKLVELQISENKEVLEVLGSIGA